MEQKKQVDESWKEQVAQEKEPKSDASSIKEGDVAAAETAGEFEMNFINYLTSLAFQAMIFLGEIPNPMEGNKIETNLKQAKFLIDTLALLRDKTKGNLSKEEEDLLNGSIYELQLKYVEKTKAESLDA